MFECLIKKIKGNAEKDFKAAANKIRILIDDMPEDNIKETDTLSLESLWNASQMIARDKSLSFANAKNCFLPKMNSYVAEKIGISEDEFCIILESYKHLLIDRGKIEITYWNNCMDKIKNYSHEKAIEELIKAKKPQEKINVISAYIDKLCR